MVDMQNKLKLNQTINQSINEGKKKKKKKQKSVFTPANVWLSKNKRGENKKVIKCEIWQTEGKSLDKQYENSKRSRRLRGAALQCITLHLIWKEIFAAAADLQTNENWHSIKQHTHIDVENKEGFLDAHFKGLV